MQFILVYTADQSDLFSISRNGLNGHIYFQLATLPKQTHFLANEQEVLHFVAFPAITWNCWFGFGKTTGQIENEKLIRLVR